MPLTAEQKDARKLRAALKELTQAVAVSVALIDQEMHKPSTVDRGKRMAALTGHLEMANDVARHIHLGEPFPLKRPKVPA